MWTILPNLLWFLFCFRTNLTASAHTHISWSFCLGVVVFSTAETSLYFRYLFTLRFSFLSFFFHFILFMRCLLLSLFSIYTLRDSGIKTKKLVPILKKIEFEIEPQNVSVKKWNSFYLHWIYFKHSRTRWYLAVLFFKVSQHHFLDRMIMA